MWVELHICIIAMLPSTFTYCKCIYFICVGSFLILVKCLSCSRMRKEEISALSGPNEFAEFYSRLRVIKDYHRKYPNEVIWFRMNAYAAIGKCISFRENILFIVVLDTIETPWNRKFSWKKLHEIDLVCFIWHI